MSLADWERAGWLIPHSTSAQEIADLLSIVERDLHDSAHEALSADWQLNIAYNAALQAAQAALAASGYRVSRSGSAHHRSIESLRLTVDLDASLVRRLDAFRMRRNITEYDRAGVTSPDEAEEMRELAVTVCACVVDWLQAHHTGLVS